MVSDVILAPQNTFSIANQLPVKHEGAASEPNGSKMNLKLLVGHVKMSKCKQT